MGVPSWLSTDPVEPKLPARVRPGWAPRPNRKVKLVGGWQAPERGAGQDENEEGPFADPGVVAHLGGGYSGSTYVPSAYDQTPPATQNLTGGGAPAITAAESGASTLAPPTAPASPVRRVLPARSTPQAASPPSSRGVSSGAAPVAPPPQGPPVTTSAAPQPLGQSQQQFLGNLGPYAMQVQQETGIPYQLLLAIPANETGWGQAVVGNNYFGIKGPGQTSRTWEVQNGQRVDTQASFKTYASPIESMRDFASLISSSPRYANVVSYLNVHPNDWRGAAQLLLNDGYATDPEWASKVISLGNQVDTGPQPSPISPPTGVKSIVDAGAAALGMRYQWGGSGGRGQSALQANTDCSGFVSWAVEQATGVRLPAQTQGIYANTTALAPKDARPGDLVMYNMGQGAAMEHVGIYAGNNMMLHDSSLNPNGGVDITPLWSGAEFRRIPNVDPSLVTRPTSSGTPQAPTTQPVQEWAIVNTNGQQVWLATGADGQEQRQVLGPAPQGMPEGQVVDAWFMHSDQPQMGMGAGQDDSPYYAGYVDPEGVEHPLPPPSEQVVSRAADLGWLGPENAPAAQGQRAEEAQYTADQAQIQDEAQYLQRQEPPVPEQPPAALTLTGQEMNQQLGRFDLSGVPTDPNRRPIAPPSPTPVPGQGPPRQPIKQVPATPPAQPPPAPPAPQAPVQGPQPLSAIELMNQPPGTEAGRASIAQGIQQANQPPLANLQGPQPTDIPGVAGAQALGNWVAEPSHQAAINAAGNIISDIADPIQTLPGVVSAIDYMRNNGYDWQAPAKKLTPDPGSALDRYAKQAAQGRQVDLATSLLAGGEAMQKMNDFRAEAVAQALPPEIRDTPEAQAAAQGIALVSDPMNLIGLPELNAGRKLMTEGIELATPAAERALGRVAGEDMASHALARPWTAQETQRVLQTASLELSPTEARLMEDASRALTAGGKYEPLSGEQIRRTVLNAVARENPNAKPGEILRMVDQTLTHAGADELTTAAVARSGGSAIWGATDATLGRLGYPVVAGMTLPEVDKLWYTNPAAMLARTEEHARRIQAIGESARQAAGVAPRFAAKLGASAVGGWAGYEAAYNRMDPNDPNRAWAPYIAGGLGAAGVMAGLSYAAPMVWRGFDGSVLRAARQLLAPVENLTADGKDVIRNWAGRYAAASEQGKRFTDRTRGIFGQDADTWLLSWIEEHGALPFKYRNNADAQAWLQDWKRITGWAVKYDLVPNDLKFANSSRVKTYVPHAVARDMQDAIKLGEGATAVRRGRVASNPFDHYTKQRTFETLRDGMKAMKSADFYDRDIARTMGNYYSAALKKLANDGLKENLLSVAAKNNGNVFASKTLRRAMLQGQDIIRLGEGNARELGDNAVHLGSIIPQFRGDDVYVSSDLEGVLNNLFKDPSFFDGFEGLGRALDFNAQFKHNILGGSAFHMVNEVRQLFTTQGFSAPKNLWTMFHEMSTAGGARNFYNRHAPEMTQAIRDGLQLNMAADAPSRAWGWQSAQAFGNALVGGILGYQTGTSQEQRQNNAMLGAASGAALALPMFGGGLKTLGLKLGPEARSMVQVFSDALWQRYIPFMKYTTYEMYKPQYGGRAAAEFANEVYGGMNLMAVGRSRTVQDIAKLWLLAPDWQEGWARQVGNAAFDWQGPLGQMNRTYWRNAAIQSVVALEAMNRVFGGKWSWENDPAAWGLVNMTQFYDQMGWDHKDPTNGAPYTPYMDILGPYRAMLEPLRETARAATVGTASALGFKPADVPFHREIYGDFGDVPTPDPAKAWTNFASTRVGFLPTSLTEFRSDKDWAGRPIDQPDDSGMQRAFNHANQVLQHIVPTGQQGLVQGAQRGDPWPLGVFSAFSGMRLSRQSQTNKYFNMRDQFTQDLGVSPDKMQDRLNQVRIDNQVIVQNQEILQSGQGSYTDAHGATHDVSKMTARERDAAIIAESQRRVNVHEQLQALIDERNQQVGLSDEDKAKFALQLRWLDNQTVIGSTSAPADIEGRPDLDQNELMRLAWNRDPTEIARIQGTTPPASVDWTQLRQGPQGTDVVAQQVWDVTGQALDKTLLRPAPGSDATRQLSTLRARWTMETAAQWNIDPAVMDDTIKARLYNVGDLPKLPGITSAQLDDIVNGYENAGRDAQDVTSTLAKQDYLFETASQHGVDPQDLQTRIRLRTLPMADQTAASTSRSNALDLLSGGKMVPYQNPDGSPFGDPKKWADWDSLLVHAKDRTTFRNGLFYNSALGHSADELNQINAAKQQANANRFKQVNLSPNREDYQRWFGDGANMTDAQWQQLQDGTLDMWTDKPTPAEAKRRVAVLRLAQGYTKQALNDSSLKFTYTDSTGYRYTNDTLAAYVHFINSVKDTRYAYVGATLDPTTN